MRSSIFSHYRGERRSAGLEFELKRPELEELSWVIVHGRGVIHTAHAMNICRLTAYAAMAAGKDAVFFMRYDDAPERVSIPLIYYAVMGNPKIEVLIPDEPEPIGELFDVIVVLDSSMLLHRTSQRALMFDGARKNAYLVVNTSLSPSQVLELVKKHQLAQEWSGKILTIKARKYKRDFAFGVFGAVARALVEKGIVTKKNIEDALISLKWEGKAKVIWEAFDAAEELPVSVLAEEVQIKRGEPPVKPPDVREPWNIEVYRQFQKAAALAPTYEDRLKAMPRWEALAPGLIEFGPDPGQRNIGFTTSFTRYQRPVHDATKCIDCKQCTVNCPDGAIDYIDTSKIDYDYCKGCGVCSQVCPTKAKTMVPELKAVEGLEDTELITLEEALLEFGF